MTADPRPACVRPLIPIPCAVLTLMLVACAPAATSSPISRVSGVAVAGPMCPVVTDPPQSGCNARPVGGARLVVRDEAGNQVATVTTGQDGGFSVELPPGSYLLQPQPVEGLMGTAPEMTFIVVAGEPADLTVSYDTGIR